MTDWIECILTDLIRIVMPLLGIVALCKFIFF